MFKKVMIALISIIFGLSLVGCNNTKENSLNKMEKVLDSNIQNQLVQYNFLYEFKVPDSDISYNCMWEGYDLENKFGPQIPKENRLYTYLTEYYEAEPGYFVVYLKDSLINDLKDIFKAYEASASLDINNYHFSEYSKEEIIDGKYLFAYQPYEYKQDSDISFYHVKDYKDILYKIGDYQLVFCCQQKKGLIKENLSRKEAINKNINLYLREELIFADKNKSPERYVFNTYEQYNKKMVKELFGYVGERIEVFHKAYEDMEYGYYPLLGNGLFGLKTVRADILSVDNVKYVVLPRYVLDGKNKIDLLDENTNFIFEEDVFREYKADFLKAFFRLYDNNTKYMEYGLYKYSEVLKILK